MTLGAKRKLLWMGPAALPDNIRSVAAGHWDVMPVVVPFSADRLGDAPVVAVSLSGQADNDPLWLQQVLDELDQSSAVGVFLVPPGAKTAGALLERRHGQFLVVAQDASPAELAAKLDAAASLQPAIEHLRTELAAGKSLGPVASSSAGLDEELRLAARLQRDFLPHQLPVIGFVRFGAVYRPAGWVGGDIYEVARLDETHVGFYVADAVGHGMPAALLTMFIKKALPTKRIVGHSYQIVPPDEALADLNADICQQNLSSCQFCTAVYAVLDASNLVLTYSRAGHPEPLLLKTDGNVVPLKAEGGLLGIFPELQFVAESMTLARGERLVVFTDGAEEALCRAYGLARDEFHLVLKNHWAGKPRQDVLTEAADRIDSARHAGRADDDATLLIVDIE